MAFMDRRHTFDEVALQYDAMRPGYPDALVDRVLCRARLKAGDRILEVGAGTGIATLPYAVRGYRILCLEPGPNLAAIARRKVAAYAGVEVREQDFESWEVEPGAFGLLFSATAWHHVDPGVRYTKARLALKPRGALAIYANWNVGVYEEGQAAYRRFVPEWNGKLRETVEVRMERALASLRGSGCFTRIETARFPWRATFTEDQYIALLGTFSDHLLIPADSREALFGALRDCIRRAGGSVSRDFESVLFLAEPVPG